MQEWANGGGWGCETECGLVGAGWHVQIAGAGRERGGRHLLMHCAIVPDDRFL